MEEEDVPRAMHNNRKELETRPMSVPPLLRLQILGDPEFTFEILSAMSECQPSHCQAEIVNKTLPPPLLRLS